MHALLSMAMVAMTLMTGVATFHVVNKGARRDCLPPSGQSIESLFAPCLGERAAKD
jgi:hypothetical protein